MNIEKLKTYWYPLLATTELKKKPLAQMLLGVDLVLVRLGKEVKCFENLCPHRGVALSNSSVTNNSLQCHYHGWRFDALGSLVEVPGCIQENDRNICLKRYAVHEDDGLIWVRLEGDRAYKPLFFREDAWVHTRKFKYVEADFIHCVENFLDPIHTLFVHKNILRSSGQQRMQVSQSINEEGFCTHYALEDKQNGLINKLFDKGVNVNIATFTLPGFAAIEYIKEKKVLFRVAVFFVPLEKGKVQMCVDVSFPKVVFLPKSLNLLLLRPFVEFAFYQDKKILEEQYKQTKKLGQNFRYQSVETDLVIDHLLHLFAFEEEGVVKNIEIKL